MRSSYQFPRQWFRCCLLVVSSRTDAASKVSCNICIPCHFSSSYLQVSLFFFSWSLDTESLTPAASDDISSDSIYPILKALAAAAGSVKCGEPGGGISSRRLAHCSLNCPQSSAVCVICWILCFLVIVLVSIWFCLACTHASNEAILVISGRKQLFV